MFVPACLITPTHAMVGRMCRKSRGATCSSFRSMRPSPAATWLQNTLKTPTWVQCEALTTTVRARSAPQSGVRFQGRLQLLPATSLSATSDANAAHGPSVDQPMEAHHPAPEKAANPSKTIHDDQAYSGRQMCSCARCQTDLQHGGHQATSRTGAQEHASP